MITLFKKLANLLAVAQQSSPVPQVFLKESCAEKDGWEVKAYFLGVYTETRFKICTEGDPMGVVTLSYKGQTISLGNTMGVCPCCNRMTPSLPVNFCHKLGTTDLHVLLVNSFVNKFNSYRPDVKLVYELTWRALTPYRNRN